MRKYNEISKEEAIFRDISEMSIWEKRFIYCALLHLMEKRIKLTSSIVSFSASIYAEKFNVSVDEAYKALKHGATNLFERAFTYIELSDRGYKCFCASRWVGSISYTDAELRVGAEFSPCTHQFLNSLLSKKCPIGLMLEELEEKSESLLEG